MVPLGYEANIYGNASMTGEWQRIFGIQDQYGQMGCIDLDFHPETFTIGPIGQGSAVGSWVQVQSYNGQMDYCITVGVTASSGSSEE